MRTRVVLLYVGGWLALAACSETSGGSDPNPGPFPSREDAGGRSDPDATSSDAGARSPEPGARPDAAAVGDDAGTRAPPSAGVSPCENPEVIRVGPGEALATLRNVSDSPGASVVMELEPGSYGQFFASAPMECLHMMCVDGQECRLEQIYVDAWRSGLPDADRYGKVIIEGMTFVGKGSAFGGTSDYGIAAYGIDELRIANNAFRGEFMHDISTKEAVGYAEIVDNTFSACQRHCIEIGQNGNVPPRPSTCGTMVVRGNVFDGVIGNALTQRYNLELIIEENEFRDTRGYAVMNWPFWRLYPWGGAGTDTAMRVPSPSPLRTEIVNNVFVGQNRLRFEGRGVRDDFILIRGNTGTPTCTRTPMESGTAAAHENEETTDPPQLDSNSDVSCSVD